MILPINPESRTPVIWADQNPPGRENFKINLKRRLRKLSVKPQQLLLPKKNGKTLCVAYALLRDNLQ